MRILALTIYALCAVATVSANAAQCPQDYYPTPGRGDCPADKNCPLVKRTIGIVTFGRLNDLAEIWDFKNKVKLLTDESEMRQSMGGASIGCERVVTNEDKGIIAVVTGHQKDLVHVYGLIRNQSGMVTGVQRAIVRFRDGKDIDVSIERATGDVLVRFGRERDLRTRLCFGPRSGTEPYGQNEWGWFSGTPRTGNFPPCQRKMTTGSSGNANWGQQYFDVGGKG